VRRVLGRLVAMAEFESEIFVSNYPLASAHAM